jgi:hypothetical protein
LISALLWRDFHMAQSHLLPEMLAQFEKESNVDEDDK